MNGIVRVVVGYSGGKEKNPTYQSIKDATEAYLIEFDPSKVSFEKILDEVRNVFFLHQFNMDNQGQFFYECK